MDEKKAIESYTANLRRAAMAALSDYWDGSKFDGSLGPVPEWTFVDYWTLRKRSMRLFRTNIYARGVIRRLVWNEIHNGVKGTPTPEGRVIWGGSRALENAVEWGEKIAVQFDLYAGNPAVFDWGRKLSFGAFQELVRMESLVCGDGIIISRIDEKTGLPRWQWVNGDNVQTPPEYVPADGGYIKYGVEFDRWGKRVAFHVRTEVNGEYSFERIPVRAKKTGRLISWMVYGSERLMDDVRGEPFLADSIYMLKDLDRTRDAEVRASLVNAMIPLFLEEAPGAMSMARPTDLMRSVPAAAGGGGNIPVSDGIMPRGYDVNPPTNQIDIMNPGTVYRTPQGGKIQSFQTNRPNVNYSVFEKSIIAVLAWSHGLPPEILMMEFQSNYSASRQANNEFEIYLSRFTASWAASVTQTVYNETLRQMVLAGVLNLPKYMKALMENDWQVLAAWQGCTWTGLNRPSIDPEKEARASQLLLDNGLSTYDIETRRHTGLSFAQVQQTLKHERELMERMGFVPHTMEDNNGKPVYGGSGATPESSGADDGGAD